MGITIDDRLTWKPQINNCLLKLNKCLYAIYKLRLYTNLSTLKLVYNALAYPHIQYCLSVWGGAPTTSLLPLLRKQKQIIRAMLFKGNTCPSSPLFLKLNLLKLNEIYKFKLGILMHKQGKHPNIKIPKPTPISSVHNHNTRLNNNTNYYVSTVNSNLAKTTFKYSGPTIWNTIPTEIKQSSTFKFKTLYKNYLLTSYRQTP